MKKFLIATHGHLASGFKSSLKLLVGAESKIDFIDAYVDETDVEDGIKAFIKQAQGEPCVILTDIVGGSVNQKAMLLASGAANVFIISGVNLPIVLSLVTNTEPLTADLINTLIGQSQLKLMPRQTIAATSDKEDFFD